MWERGGRKEGVLPDLSSHGAGQAVAVVKISSFSVKFSWVNCGNDFGMGRNVPLPRGSVS